MATSHPSDEQPRSDGRVPDELEQLVGRALDVEPASPGFRAALGERLAREVALLYGASSNGQRRVGPAPPAAGSGADEQAAPPAPAHAAAPPLGIVGVEAGEPPAAEPAADTIAMVAPRRSWWSVACKWGAVAACLVVAVFWWGSNSRYSFAAMVAALEHRNWVQVIARIESGLAGEGWLSSSRGVVAVRNGRQAQFDDLREGVSLACQLDEAVVGRQSLVDRQAPSAQDQLVFLLLNTTSASPAGDAAASRNLDGGQVRIRKQSWQWTDAGSVALTVSVTVDGRSADPVQMQFEVDPQTQLPRSARLAVHSNQPVAVNFNYPSTGPADIYMLGVSRDFPVVPAAEVAATVARLRAAAEEAKAKAAKPAEVVASRTPVVTPEVIDRISQVAPQPADAAPAAPPKELPPPLSIEEMRARVDEILQKDWAAGGITPVARATDEEFMRRAYLDFLGRIPTVSEVRAFLSDGRPNRREALIDSLVEMYDHSSHLAAVWRTFLIPATADTTEFGGTGPFEEWLTERFRGNQPYDKLVSDLLLAEGRAKEAGPLLFYTALKLKPEEIARQSARAFLGMRLDCAQCHDHFFDENWKQRDFWGYTAFFSRISQPEGKIDRVSPVLRIRDTSRGEAMLPGTGEVVPPHYPLDSTPVDAAGKESRRRLLAAWLSSSDNPYFARATVNRVWFELFGRGLVNPVDDMRPANKPISPEALAELADYFIRSGYDLRRLYVTLARTEAYQLSSSAPDDDPARPLHFAQMNTKCFTAEQLYDCIAVATRVEAVSGSFGLNRVNNSPRQQFIEQFRSTGEDRTEYQSGITQALALMNGNLTQNSTQLQSSGLLRSLQAPFFTDEQRVETLFLATVSRRPTELEREKIVGYLKDASSPADRTQVLGDTLWALLNSAEFALIH